MLARITDYEKTLSNLQVPFEPFVITERKNAAELEAGNPRRPIESDILTKADEKLENGSLWDMGAESQRYYSHGLLVKLAEEVRYLTALLLVATTLIDVSPNSSKKAFALSPKLLKMQCRGLTSLPCLHQAWSSQAMAVSAPISAARRNYPPRLS